MDLGVLALLKAYSAGTLTPEQVIHEVYDRIEDYEDPAVWISLTPRYDALARAQKVSPDLPLNGIPFALKDNIDALGHDTTAACPDYAYRPDEDAFVVKRLIEAGAILIGKTNMDQFATGLVGTRSPHGAARCVFDKDYISGGSSSGSAVAVAAGLVSFSLGTDTAGSGRVPAAFNNIVGIKPSRGLLSTRGVVPACRSLDCVTVFAGSCADGDAVRRVAEDFDAQDSWSRPMTPRALADQPTLGILAPEDRDFCGDNEAAQLYAQAIERAKSLGWTIREFTYKPFKEVALLLYCGPWVAERKSAIGAFIEANPSACDPTVAKIVTGGVDLDAVAAFEGLYKLKDLTRTCEREWALVDALLLPTAPTQYKVEDVNTDPIALNANLGLYTNFVNLLDLAAVAVPAGFRNSNALPFGVTLIAPAFTDSALAELGDALHRALGSNVGKTHHRVPPAPPIARNAEEGLVDLAVVGAHLTGMPLNHQLTSLGAKLIRTTRTAKDYRLYALKGTTPPKPGLSRDPGFEGKGLEVEVWRLTREAFGTFTQNVPPPLAIGSLELKNGSWAKGFVCEGYAITQGEDITSLGGWRNYIKHDVPPKC